MLLIAIDTSGRSGSVALCRGDQDSFEVLQLLTIQGGTYSARLMPAMAEMLEQQQVTKEEIDAFVVVSGPGSFTGLRVGIATVKALCEVLRKPLAAISMLHAIAAVRGPAEGDVVVVLDAGRQEVYVAEFSNMLQQAASSSIAPQLEKLDQFASRTFSRSTDILTPDANVAAALSGVGVTFQQVERPHAGEIGRVGLQKLFAGDVVDPATLDADYIRRSDAEIFLPPKH